MDQVKRRRFIAAGLFFWKQSVNVIAIKSNLRTGIVEIKGPFEFKVFQIGVEYDF